MKRFVSILLVLACIAVCQVPAKAAQLGTVPGLILQLTPGNQTEQELDTSLSKALGQVPFRLKSLGSNWVAVRFAKDITTAEAGYLAQRVRQSGLVNTAELDRRLQSFSAAPNAVTLGALTAKKPSVGVVRGLKVIDAYDPTRPLKAFLKVSWQPPAPKASEKVLGYQVLVTTDFGKSYRQVLTSKSPAVLLGPTEGITNGVATGVRVAVLAKVAGKKTVGSYSATSYQIPTGLPGPPQFKGDRIATVDNSPSWFVPSLEQAGGLPVTFTATALAFAQNPVSCTTTASTCQFEGLKPGVSYTVKLKATNAHGSALSEELFVPADTSYSQQWYLGGDGIKADSAWEHTRGSSKIVVAVIDSGITSHPDLDDQLLRNPDGSVAGYDFVSKEVGSGDGGGWDSNPADPSSRNQWHGTMVSGVLAAAANGQGIVGVAPNVKLLQVRTMGETGGLISDTVAGIYWAIGEKVKGVPTNRNPAKILNISIGNGQGLGCDSSAKAALAAAAKRGVSVITAAGNDARPTYFSFPGNCNASINVAAVARNFDLAEYSDFGPLVDLTAPGGEQPSGATPALEQSLGILTTSNSGLKNQGLPTYQLVEGTSFAAPQVAGVVALMLSLRSTLSSSEIEAILKTTSTQYSQSSYCFRRASESPCGAGVVNASAAIDAVLRLP
ncbi:MAG: S8 family serine peptidase [Micrococcales bacterium]